MNEGKIKELLQRADRAAGTPPGVADGLAERVRRAARRRLVVGGACAAAAAIAVFVGIAALVATFAGNDTPENKPVAQRGMSEQEIARLRVEIEQLRAEADMRMTLIKEMLAAEKRQKRLAAIQRELAKPDPLEQIQLQLEKAACITVYQADRKYNQLDLPESAIRDYRRVIELFPKTHWAEVARNRLSKIEAGKNNKGDLL